MRFFLSLILIIVFSLSLCGCNLDNLTQNNNTNNLTESTNKENENKVLETIIIKMDGKELTLPFKLSEIEDSIESYVVNPEVVSKESIVVYNWKSINGKTTQNILNVYNPNQDGKSIDVRDCFVSGFYTIAIKEENKVDLVIPGEITFGNSYQDVVEYYGEPSKKVCKYNNEDLVTQADYELSNGIYISFSFEENLITSISVNI